MFASLVNLFNVCMLMFYLQHANIEASDTVPVVKSKYYQLRVSVCMKMKGLHLSSGILNFHEGTDLIRLSVIDSGDSVFVERGENG